ncbi:glycoside hydrolase family 44 protein [Chitinophaga rhizosphaerae]|uniref:glycoside hydrolase family 44 protein n=1 Tax=Chitinophaga rhizosphaerae TaxID=1864947 RepID=UPI000F7FCDA6|nr:glycoside hydrolase family 44 protein [Chitinophaga rhizosphaerae]
MKPFCSIVACAAMMLLSSVRSSAQATRNVRFTIDASAPNRKAISPLVYGTNDHYPYAPAKRMGGNRITGYNWENNASNAGEDWVHHSDDWVPAQWNTPGNQYDVPGSALKAFHNQSLQQGAYSLATLPMAGYVARDKNGTVSENETAPSNRWVPVVARKPGGNLSLTPDVNDNAVYVDEELHFLLDAYGRSNTATGIKGYSLDNEPCLWTSTHPRLFGTTGVSVNYLMNKSYETAELIKEMDPSAEVFGPSLWGYTAYQNLQFAPDWDQVRGNYELFVHYYLANMRARSQAAGKRLLDVLDLHWYPQQNRDFGNMSPFDDENDDNSVLGRISMSRGLWDDTYQENSWVNDASNGQIFPVLPKLKQMIADFYPGTRLGITEYSYGGTSHVSGTVAQADALGAFGTEQIYFASYWGAVIGYIKSGFDLYCNYDGNGGKFGNTSVKAQTDNRAVSAVYASVNASGDEFLHTIAINRSMTDTVVATVAFSGARQYRSASVYVVDRNSPVVRRMEDIRTVENNSFQLKMPPMTVYHLVLSETDLTVYPYITDLTIAPAIGYSDGNARFTVSATITDSDNDMRPPTIDLSSLGGSATTPLVRNGDQYSIQYTVPANTASGMKMLTVSAADAAGHSVSGNVTYRVIRELPSTDIWNGDAIRGGEGERFNDGSDQTAGTQIIERRATGGNTGPGSLYMRFKHDPNYWGLMTWRIDPNAGGARDVSEFGYLEFYIRSNAPEYADITFSVRDASANMNVSNSVNLKANGYISSFHPTQFTKVKIPFSDLFTGSGFDLTRLWQFNFLVNSAQDGFDVWIDDVRALPYDNPTVQPVLSDVRINPAAGFADGITPVQLSVLASDPNNDLASVTVDLSPVGGANNQPLLLVNGRYTASFTVPATTPPGPRSFHITATDQKGNTAQIKVDYLVWGRASSDVIWDGDTKNPGIVHSTSNNASLLVVRPTGGNKGPINMSAHIEPNPEPFAYVFWDLAQDVDARMVDLRQKRYLNFSIRFPNTAGLGNFDLQIFLKDRFGGGSNAAFLLRDKYLTQLSGNYQQVRIPLADMVNGAEIDPSKVALIGFLSEQMPNSGVDFQVDDIYLSGSPVADVEIVTQPSACGNNGRIEVKKVVPPSGNYQYSIGGAAQASPVFENLQPGQFDLRITGPDNFVYVETVVISGGQGLQGNIQVNDQAGDIDLTITGGSGNYIFAWSNNATTEDLTNVPSGDYTVNVKDNVSGCTYHGTAKVTRQQVVLFTVKNAQCFPNGIITATVSNGSGVYQYYINGKANPNGINSNIFGQLEPGVYTIRVTNANGFDYSQAVTMGGTLNDLLITQTIDHRYGNIDITITGGSGSYRINWAHGSTVADQSGLASGQYHIEVTDRTTQCATAMTLTVTRTGPDVTFTATGASCNTGGTITVSTTGASAAPYQYFINGQANPAGINQPVFRNLQADFYEVRITGANGFEKNERVEVDGWMNDMDVTSQIDQTTGAIDVTVTGGSGNYTYRWSTGATTQDVSNLATGDYWMEVTDASAGCVTRKDFRVTRPVHPTITFTVTNANCGANGVILVNLSAGTPSDFRYFIDNRENPAGPANREFRHLAPGNYAIRVTGSGGFSNTQTVTVAGTVNRLVIIGTADEDGNINISVNGGSGNYQYLWSDKSTTEDLEQRAPGLYTVNVTDKATGCTAQFSILVAASRESLWIYPNPALEGFRVKYVIPESSKMELTVTDLFGRVTYRQVLTESQGNIYVPATKLRSGMYFVQVKSGKHKQTRPVIIAK